MTSFAATLGAGFVAEEKEHFRTQTEPRLSKKGNAMKHKFVSFLWFTSVETNRIMLISYQSM